MLASHIFVDIGIHVLMMSVLQGDNYNVLHLHAVCVALQSELHYITHLLFGSCRT
jgi:hypothetical protein